jgi:hypothetical protein
MAEAITLPSPTASKEHRRPTIPQNYNPAMEPENPHSVGP